MGKKRIGKAEWGYIARTETKIYFEEMEAENEAVLQFKQEISILRDTVDAKDKELGQERMRLQEVSDVSRTCESDH